MSRQAAATWLVLAAGAAVATAALWDAFRGSSSTFVPDESAGSRLRGETLPRVGEIEGDARLRHARGLPATGASPRDAHSRPARPAGPLRPLGVETSPQSRSRQRSACAGIGSPSCG
jgi:hypothetical protein